MPGVTIVVHDYRPEDLGQVLQLWQQTGGFDAEGLAVDQSVELLSTAGAFAVVAEADNQLVGAVLAAAAANIGWIYRLSLLPGQPEEQEIAERLLAALETRAAEAGVHKLAAVVPQRGELAGHLSRRKYRASDNLRYFERELPAAAAPGSALAELGGTMINPGLWDELKGMKEAKEIIERRVILPLAEPDLAGRHGVVPPRAIVLFGPPGTGKTTFAKGIAAQVEETKVRLSNKTDDLQLLDEMLQDKDPKVRMAAPVLKQKLKAAQRQRAAGLDQTGGSVTVDTRSGSIREILEARIRDPKVSARDLASLTNALIKLDEDLATARDSMEQTLVFPFEDNPAVRVVRVYVLPTDDTILSRDEWPAAEAPPEEELLQPPSGYELAPPPKRNLDGSIAGSKPEPEPEEDDDLEDRERPIPG